MLEILNNISNTVKQLNIDSTGLIALSSLFGVASLYHLNQQDLGLFIFYTLIFYFIDLGIEKNNLNNMFKNMIYLFLFAYILFTTYSLSTHYVLLLVLGVVAILWYLYTSCNVENNKSTFCVENADTLKMFGNGSITLILLLTTIYLSKSYCKKHVLDVSKPFVW